jgi:prepilin-type N-terminal cleavage/methylation domain-containing protein
MGKRRSAFTLTEILIVIALIAILAAILMPVFARVKLASKQSVCTPNLRQCGIALNMYLDSNDCNYPARTFFGKYIRSTSAITATTGPTLVFRFSLDRPEGRGALPFADRHEPGSKLRPGSSGRANPGRARGTSSSFPTPIPSSSAAASTTTVFAKPWPPTQPRSAP